MRKRHVLYPTFVNILNIPIVIIFKVFVRSLLHLQYLLFSNSVFYLIAASALYAPTQTQKSSLATSHELSILFAFPASTVFKKSFKITFRRTFPKELQLIRNPSMFQSFTQFHCGFCNSYLKSLKLYIMSVILSHQQITALFTALLQMLLNGAKLVLTPLPLIVLLTSFIKRMTFFLSFVLIYHLLTDF